MFAWSINSISILSEILVWCINVILNLSLRFKISLRNFCVETIVWKKNQKVKYPPSSPPSSPTTATKTIEVFKFCKTEKLVSKFVQKHKRSRAVEIILRKQLNKTTRSVGVITITVSDYMLYYRVPATRTAWYSNQNRNIDYWNRTEDICNSTHLQLPDFWWSCQQYILEKRQNYQ